MSDFAAWLVDLVKSIFVFLWDFTQDLVISMFGALLDALAAVIGLLVLPCFATVSAGANGLQQAFNTIAAQSPTMMWFLHQLPLQQGLGMLACAVIFLLARKLATLFQW